MTLMLLPNNKYLFLGVDGTHADIDLLSKFYERWMQDPKQLGAFMSLGVAMVIDARVTPAIAINVP
jgi:hypothetical protein